MRDFISSIVDVGASLSTSIMFQLYYLGPNNHVPSDNDIYRKILHIAECQKISTQGRHNVAIRKSRSGHTWSHMPSHTQPPERRCIFLYCSACDTKLTILSAHLSEFLRSKIP